MLVYILKSVACLAILFVFYKVFLEKENMHIFKRFYLLGALIFSLIIPSLVFTEYVEVEPTPIITESIPVLIQQPEYSNDVINVPPALEADVLDIEPVLWGIYFIGLFFFGLKFIRNLFQIFRRIRKNPKQRISRFTQVLLQEKITPHTFFSYIFLNKKKFETDQIPAEVLLHEQTHASQKHSWDVILVELLHVIFWINPFIYLTKKAIKLNHEFLADQAVLKENIDKTTYQNTLLSYLSPDSEKKYQPLANAINYSSTRLTVFGKTFTFGSTVGQVKKRFTVMKTHTSKKAVLLRSLLLLPLLALMFYGFSERIVEEQFSSDHTSRLINDIVVNIDIRGNLSLNNKKLGLDEIGREAQRLTAYLTNGERKNFITAHIVYNEEHLDSIENVQSQLFEVGIHHINHVSKKTSSVLGRPDFIPSKYQNKTVEEARVIQKETFAWYESIWFDIKNESKIWHEDKLIPLEDLAATISNVASGKSEEDDIKVQFYTTGILRSNFVDQINAEARKANAKEVQVFTEEYIMSESDFIEEGIDPNSVKVHLKANKMSFKTENATKEQLVKYNTLAKKYNAIPIEKRLIPLKDLKILETVFRKMSSNQKSENQPFPEYLSKNAQDGASRKQMAEYNNLAKHYNDMQSNNMRIKMKDVERLEYIYGLMSKKQKADAEPFPDFPEPPPEPKAPKAVKEPKELKSPKPAKAPKEVKETKEPKAPKPVKAPKALGVLKGEVSDIPPPTPNNQEIEEVKELEEEARIREQEVLMERQESQLVEQEILMEKEEAKLVEQEILMEKEEAKLEQQKIIIEQKEAELEETEEELQRVKYIRGEVETDILEPPTPPTPKSPLDHVIDMARKGAKFYLEGKEITSDKAIEVMKKNKDINIDSRSSKGKRPVVKMSTKPIKIGYSIPKSKADLQKVELVAMRSNEDLERQKTIKRYMFFSENFRNCSEYFFDGKSISEGEALSIYLQNEDISISQEGYDNKDLIIKC